MDISVNYTEQLARELFSSIREAVPESTKEMEEEFQSIKSSLDPETINFCLKPYLHAEFDWNTPGNRGLGRLSEAIPRLGAYFRKPISKLTVEQLRFLDELLTRIIVKAYLFQMIISDYKIELDGVRTMVDVFNEWVPLMYGTDLLTKYKQSEDMMACLGLVFWKDIERLKDSFTSYGLKPGMFQPDIIDQILFSYLNIGLILRLVHANKEEK